MDFDAQAYLNLIDNMHSDGESQLRKYEGQSAVHIYVIARDTSIRHRYSIVSFFLSLAIFSRLLVAEYFTVLSLRVCMKKQCSVIRP